MPSGIGKWLSDYSHGLEIFRKEIGKMNIGEGRQQNILSKSLFDEEGLTTFIGPNGGSIRQAWCS